MKRLTGPSERLCVVLFSLFLFLPGAQTAHGFWAGLENTAYRKVIDDLTDQVVAALPDDIHFRLLAVGPIEGDDGALADTLTARIKAKTRFHLIERKDMDKILKEQGIQLSPISDPRKPIEFGKIKGVEGILLGRITKRTCSMFYCEVSVFFKLDNVEKGDIVFAEDFSANHIPGYTTYGAAAIVFLILLGFYANHRKKARLGKAVRVVQKDAAKNQGIRAELKKAIDNMNRAQDAMTEDDSMDLSSGIRAVRVEADLLLSKLELAPGAHPDAVDKKTRTQLEWHGKAMQGLVKNILAESEILVKSAIAKDRSAVHSTIDALKGEVKNAANRFHDHPVGRS